MLWYMQRVSTFCMSESTHLDQRLFTLINAMKYCINLASANKQTGHLRHGFDRER